MSFASQPAQGIDILGALSSRLAQHSRGRGRGVARRSLGARLSANDLRARGVDETFLAPAANVDAGESGALSLDGESSKASVAFIRSVTTEEASPHQGSTKAKGAAERQKEWTPAEMQEEYGIGYSLLARMGYGGGGRVPLAPVKRAPRIGLQDNEDLAVDRSAPAATSKKRRKKSRILHSSQASTKHDAAGKRCCRPSDMTMSLDKLETSSTPEVLVEDSSSDDSLDDSEESEDARLANAILAVMQIMDRQLKLSELIELPRIRRALCGRLDNDGDMQQFLKEFVRSHVPQCRIRRSTASDWYKLSSHSSKASWQTATRSEHVIVMRPLAEKVHNNVSIDPGCESSSDEMFAASVDKNIRPSKCSEGYRCHGCGEAYSSRASLRDHVLEKLAARTTQDPTDLFAQFDPEHRDRAILEAAAKVAEGGQFGWHCPVCRWCSTEASSSFEDLISHAFSSPEVRAKHQRFLAAVAELLIQEPPPPRTSTSPWCSSGLRRLFQVTSMNHMQVSNRTDYAQLEEEMVGPEEDIFGGPVSLDERGADFQMSSSPLCFGPEPLTFV